MKSIGLIVYMIAYIKEVKLGVLCIMLIILGNGMGDPSSNSWRGYCDIA